MFNERKVAQMVAFFPGQPPACRMLGLKLMKLLYLSDRQAMREFGWPISGDWLVWMPHGQCGSVLSQTLGLMDGDVESMPGVWGDLISDKKDHELSLRRPIHVTDFDELSSAEVDVPKDVRAKFGSVGKWEICDWIHRHCAEFCTEWRDSSGASSHIQYEKLAMVVGYDRDVTDELAAQIKAQQEIDCLFAAL